MGGREKTVSFSVAAGDPLGLLPRLERRAHLFPRHPDPHSLERRTERIIVMEIMVMVHQVVRLMVSRMMLAVGQMVVCQMDEAPHDPMVPRDEAPDDPMVEIVRDGRDWCFDLQDLLRVLVVEVWNLSTA